MYNNTKTYKTFQTLLDNSVQYFQSKYLFMAMNLYESLLCLGCIALVIYFKYPPALLYNNII